MMSSYLYMSLGLRTALCDVQQTSFQQLLFGSKWGLLLLLRPAAFTLYQVTLVLCWDILPLHLEDITVLHRNNLDNRWQLLCAVHALFLWETVARLCVGRHVSRTQWGFSFGLPSPAEIRNVYQGEARGSKSELLSPKGISLRLIDYKVQGLQRQLLIKM